MRPFTIRTSYSSRLNSARCRLYSQGKPSNPSATSNPISQSLPSKSSIGDVAQTQKQHGRIDRLLKRTPKFLHRHVASLRSAPITHVSAFLILHELTAIVPLLGLVAAFHYYHWLPTYFSEGAWVMAGVEKFGRYFKRKGWITGDEKDEADRLVVEGHAEQVEKTKRFDSGKWWNKDEDSVRLVVEFATAYAIVKALLIPRLFLSAWGAPWFARWTVVPLMNGLKRAFGRNKGLTKTT